MKLSVIVITYDMAREIPRTLQGLARDYQHGARGLDYEVLLVDNGSPEPPNPSTWAHLDVPVRLITIPNASPSPAKAFNVAMAEAKGEILCLMIDGAHLLTPGVFRMALASYAAYQNPVVATRYFWMGPEGQNESILKGYSKAVEDENLRNINWPQDGYRLFEIGSPLRAGPENISWFNRLFESCCLFVNRQLFQELGGVDERFNLPGGGLINSDIFKRTIDAPGVTAVQLVGEGSFHQLHGGTTTNVSTEKRNAEVLKYREQYEEIHGHLDIVTHKTFYFMGHLPTKESKIHRLKPSPQ